MQRAFPVLIAFHLVTLTGMAAMRETPHPYMLWTRDDAAAIQKRLETEPWAKTALERQRTGNNASTVYNNLFNYLITGDAQAAQTEKAYLLSFIGAPVNEREWSDNYLSALRYDVLYDILSPDERSKVEATFRAHIEWQLTKDTRTYTKTNWLPNMQWPRPMGIYLMAVALRDESLIRKCFNDRCGWKYYFDDYVSDGYFYNEEFGKQYSMIGEMLLWCRGLERLGLDEMGYGYTGKGGATMRRYLEGIVRLGYPRFDLGSNRPAYPKITIGDAKGGRGFHHTIVNGYSPDGNGGQRLFNSANMNGRDHKDRIIEKMMEPLWFEIAHAKWPDAGFDYFLAQMRTPQDEHYIPTLYFGVTPIDPAKVKAPPAPSWAAVERGICLLRADESPAYWESPAPAVSLRFATPYVHDVPDAFALAGFWAFHRPIYVNHSCAPGYAGTDPGWSSSIRSHCGIIVDALEPRNVGPVPVRTDFSPEVKFVAVRAQGVYPDVDMTRALFLTREYLLDITRLASPYTRSYQWLTHPVGTAVPDRPNAFAPTRNLLGTLFDTMAERSTITGDTWAVTTTQEGKDRVGVRMTMLGAAGTVATTALGPVVATVKDRFNYGETEPGIPVVIAARSARETEFIAVHEPFRGTYRIVRVTEIVRAADAVVIAITGTPASGIDDRIMFRWGDKADQPITLSGDAGSGPETFTFTGFAYRRGTAPAHPTVPAVATIGTTWQPNRLCLPTGGRTNITLRLRNTGAVAGNGTINLTAPEGVTLAPATLPLADLPPGELREMSVQVAVDAAKTGRSSFVDIAVSGAGVDVQNTRLQVVQGVVSEPSLYWPRDFARTVYAPRYTVKYYYMDSVAAAFMLDPDGKRRFGKNPLPILRTLSRDGEGRERWDDVKLGGFSSFMPVPNRDKDGQPPFLVDPGTHPHGYRSPFEMRFTEDWIVTRYKDTTGTVSYAWNGDESSFEKSWVHTGGKVVDAAEVKGTPEVRAIFQRIAGTVYGRATFYPAGSVLVRSGKENSILSAAQPGNQPMAFTFCTDDEFSAHVDKWLHSGDLAPVKSWGQGDLRRN